jgi:hypothetical protein
MRKGGFPGVEDIKRVLWVSSCYPVTRVTLNIHNSFVIVHRTNENSIRRHSFYYVYSKVLSTSYS